MAAPVLDAEKAEKAGNTRTLAEFLVGLRYDDIPAFTPAITPARSAAVQFGGSAAAAAAVPISVAPAITKEGPCSPTGTATSARS